MCNRATQAALLMEASMLSLILHCTSQGGPVYDTLLPSMCTTEHNTLPSATSPRVQVLLGDPEASVSVGSLLLHTRKHKAAKNFHFHYIIDHDQ